MTRYLTTACLCISLIVLSLFGIVGLDPQVSAPESMVLSAKRPITN